METWIWIVIAIVAVLAIVFVTGLVLARKRKVSLVAPDKDKALDPASPPESIVPKTAPKGGGYKAGGSISFSSGTGGAAAAPKERKPVVEAHPVADRPETDGQPGVGDDASVPRDSAQDSVVDVALPEPVEAPDTEPVVAAVPAEPEATERPVTENVAAETVAVDHDADQPVAVEPVETEPVPVETQPTTESDAEQAEELLEPSIVAEPEDTVVTDVEVTQAEAEELTTVSEIVEVGETEVVEITVAPVETIEEAEEAAAAAVEVATGAEAALVEHAEAPVVVPAPAFPADDADEARDHIDPTTGRLSRLRGRLSRSQNAFGRSLLGLLGAGALDEDSWQDVEDTLLMADLGAAASAELTERLKAEVAARGVSDIPSARALLREVLVDAVDLGIADRSVRALPHDGRPAVVLVVGVNGTGKTTTTGKLARVLVADGLSVVLGAADTFRAAAADQLQTWGERAGATVVRSEAGADPAAVAFDAVKRGITDGADAVLIDTAGRLHTKTGLMDELGKVKRVVEKQAVVDEVLLVLDATTGQNGLIQAKVFAEVVDITGIVLTKLDGTAKGGIVVAVQRALGVPVKLVGLGEGPDDLAPFEAGAFVDALLG